MLRNLVFDWSGTLCDDLVPVIATSNAVLERHGSQAMTREQFLEEFELPYTRFYDRFLPNVPIADLEASWVELFPEDGGEVAAIDGARRMLETAHSQGRRLFLLSSVPKNHFDAQAAKCGLPDLFEDHFNSAVDKRDSLRELLAKHRLDTADTAYVGDMVHDMQTARALGVTAVGVATGYEPAAALHAAGAHFVLDNLSVLARLLEAENRGREQPVSTVGALLHDGEGRVLLVRTSKWSGTWGIPGGKIERGESSEFALRREIREETGLEIDDIEFVLVQDAVEPPQFMRPAHFLLLNYVARALPGKVVLNDEAEEYRWVPISEVERFNLNEPTIALVDEVVRRGLVPGAATRS